MILFFFGKLPIRANHKNHNNLRSIFFIAKCLIMANHKNHENPRSVLLCMTWNADFHDC